MSIEERLSNLEKWVSRSKRISLVKTLVYFIIIIGIISYVYSVNSSIDEWSVKVSGKPDIAPAGVTLMEVSIPVSIYNPGDKVTAKYIFYRIYFNNYYVGEGFIPYLDLDSGYSEHMLRATIDLSRIGCSVAESIYNNSGIEVRVVGIATVDLYLFGVVPWKSVTLSFNHTVSNVTLPELDPGTRQLLHLYVFACRNSDKIYSVVEWVVNAAESGSSLVRIP
ncbi:MAG: hypothetical protein GSR86_04355 [Desulfurococcales archaeon]|nr:hypothetical protein [Desulfurococcales archaeon]